MRCASRFYLARIALMAGDLGRAEQESRSLLDEPAVALIPWRIRGMRVASISTGGAIISGPAYDPIGSDMVDR